MTRNASEQQASQLAREIARESLFLPERERVWLLAQLQQHLEDADLPEHETERLNMRMGEAIAALDRVADHLELEGSRERLCLTMRQFDAAPESVRDGWRAGRVAEALRGSWELAKGIAFNHERLPVVAERQWKAKKKLTRKRREGRFSLTCIHDWLATEPEKKTRAAYSHWRDAENKRRQAGDKAALGDRAILRRWPGCFWAEIVQAVEEDRLPGEANEESDGETIRAVESAQGADGEDSGADGSLAERPALVLDYEFRARQLREAREALGWTTQELSKRSGIDQSTIRKIENGEVFNPSFERVAKLAHALNLSLDGLVAAA